VILPRFHCPLRLSFKSTLSMSMALLVVGLAAGCGGSGGSPKLNGNTAVTLSVSSQGNDKLYQVNLGLTEITLTNQAGKTVSLLNSPANPTPTYSPEFIHLNGSAEPLVTVSIPQDTYTSASVTFARGGLVCIGADPSTGGLEIAHWNYDSSLSQATVSIPTPITVTGTSMGLSLQMQVSQSSSISSCSGNGTNFDSSTAPSFILTPTQLASAPTNYTNGKDTGIFAEVDSLATGSTGFTVELSHIPSGSNNWDNPTSYTLPVTVGPDTVYQGITGISSLAKGAFLDMDLEYQADGTVLATRVAVPDPTATNAEIGQLGYVTKDSSELQIFPRQALGNDALADNQDFGPGKAAFIISGQFTNVKNLPFTASFNASTLVAGQQVYITSGPLRTTGAQPVAAATSITLEPQTINGTVSSVSSSGSFKVYTVTLASYDLIPLMATLADQATVVNQPSTLQVYVDANMQTLNTTSLAAGSTLRFNGLIFNDAGTLRMDCARIMDGVAE
jgi:hypothetical protein